MSAVLRDELIAFLHREAVGPASSDAQDEVLGETPSGRYIAGVLFPREQQASEIDDASSGPAKDEPPDEAQTKPADRPKENGFQAQVGDDPDDETVRLANTYYPAALGLSFLVVSRESTLTIQVTGATYEPVEARDPEERDQQWSRRPFTKDLELPLGPKPEKKLVVDGLRMLAVIRPLSGGRVLCTVSLVNERPARSVGGRIDSRDCFFQIGLKVSGMHGERPFVPYRTEAAIVADSEERELELLYRNRHTFAVGHGCAAAWADAAGDRCGIVEAQILPIVKVPPVEPRSAGGDELSMEVLARSSPDPETVPLLLDRVVTQYEEWIAARQAEAAGLPPEFRNAAARNLQRCRDASARIRAGVDHLRRDRAALEAFQLANQAMLMQQAHSRLSRVTSDEKENELPTKYTSTERRGRWRTFQLAFVLMNVRAFGPEPDVATRGVVDLIWFPTGGGKTEAYLGLIAYAMFRERLHDRLRTGCLSIMRYTLRLLTANQFQRASALICACEKLREQRAQQLGQSRFTIGLWAGSGVSPNTNEEAVKAAKALQQNQNDQQRNVFQLLTCPWCGTALDERGPRLGYQIGGNPKTVKFVCPRRSCEFSKSQKPLPVQVVDEEIYQNPPTLLIGTIDKFAMIAWKERSGAIFNCPSVAGRHAPALIIQDELHLISGPLGSTAALYEAAIAAMTGDVGGTAKIVASTATIRRATEQVRALFGRTEFAQFPPAGLDASDSFFAKEAPDAPGRVYVGLLPTASPSPVTALVRTASYLAQGAKTIDLPQGATEAARDPYWTQVQYFGSLRELGRAATLVEADIPEHLPVVARRRNLPPDRRRYIGGPVELTSRLEQDEVPKRLEEMKKSYAGPDSRDVIDVLLATNMISVGVDVDRLGLMLVVGQPKTTSEYIQATSRVGRSRDAPGLVVTLFNAGKPRDRSHYEQFKSFHESFYRFVEPTSVTPLAAPALERVLHAVLVILARHKLGLEKPADVDDVVQDLEQMRSRLAERWKIVAGGDTSAIALASARWEQLVAEWRAMKPAIYGTFSGSQERPLMYQAGKAPTDAQEDAWPTPTSMRSVDSDCSTLVVGTDRGVQPR